MNSLKDLAPAISQHMAELRAEHAANHETELKGVESRIARIPSLIAASALDGLNYAEVMQLHHSSPFGGYYSNGQFKYPNYFALAALAKPRYDWLTPYTKMVFDFCVKFGLQPHLTKPSHLSPFHYCYMIIRWDPDHLEGLLAQLPPAA